MCLTKMGTYCFRTTSEIHNMSAPIGRLQPCGRRLLLAPDGKSWHRNKMGCYRRVNCRGSHVTGEDDHGGRTAEENEANGARLGALAIAAARVGGQTACQRSVGRPGVRVQRRTVQRSLTWKSKFSPSRYT